MPTYSGDRAYTAFRILQVTFVIAPLIAGLDKFFGFLTDWERYLAPQVVDLMQGNAHAFMMGVGIIEIIAAIGVIFKPKIFAYIVSLWLLGIVINLLLAGQYFDIALRDIGLMLSAFALGKLSQKYAV
jgi:hypothetical protein